MQDPNEIDEYIDLPPNIPETLAAMHERLNAGTARIKRIEGVQRVGS